MAAVPYVDNRNLQNCILDEIYYKNDYCTRKLFEVIRSSIMILSWIAAGIHCPHQKKTITLLCPR